MLVHVYQKTVRDLHLKRDKEIVTDFINKYHDEIDRIYDAKPGTQEYDDAVNDLVSKNDGKYIMKVKK